MAKSTEEKQMLLLIIGFVRVSYSALVHFAATAVEDVVKLAHALCLLFGSAGGCSLWYCLCGNLGVFIRLRIGLTAFVNLILVVCSWRRLWVVETLAFAARPFDTGPEFEAYRGPAPSPRFANPCRSAPARLSPHPSSRKFAILCAPRALHQANISRSLAVWLCENV